ncbi:MAG: hypothetical protein BHV68_23325 [Bacteroidales bacterium 43_8]|nr:MAG: hypothetical protein BHV68_23325 [Bacteroidales bacterium 43_8]
MDTAQYKLLLDTAQVGWWEIDFDKRVYICSDYLVSLLELKDKIIPTRDFLQLIREDYKAYSPDTGRMHCHWQGCKRKRGYRCSLPCITISSVFHEDQRAD